MNATTTSTPANSPKASVGLVGAGRMGRGMGRNLLMRGFSLCVFDPDESARSALAQLGARAVGSPREVLPGADFVITCLPDVETVRATYLGEDGLLARAAPGTVFIDTTSSSPALTQSIGRSARELGLDLVDAPLLRGAKEAWDGTVHVLLGGDPAVRARCRDVLEAFSERIVEVGELGSAHALKALNNAVSMTNAAVIGEVFHVADRMGIAAETLLDVIQGGLGDSAMLKLYGPRLVSGEHPRTGSIAFGEKDLGLLLELASAAGARTPVLESAHRLYGEMVSHGAGAEAPSRLAGLLGQGTPAR
jgi:3-hydroxyisobutyrate dehydrogenase-like beta-hydroxyacid dehydrogenase